MNTKGYSFNQAKLPDSNSIKVTPFDDALDLQDSLNLLPSFPPKTIKQLVALVDQGRSNEISLLEWLDVIENKALWQALDEDEIPNACRAIWMVICTHFSLGYSAFFKLGLAIDRRDQSIVPYLIDTMAVVRSVPALEPSIQDKIDWLLAVKEGNLTELALCCYKNRKVPRAYIANLNLPRINTYSKQLPSYLVKVVAPPLTKGGDEWLAQCFNSLRLSKEKLEFCETVITHFSGTGFASRVNDIIIEHCLPSQENSFWYNLSHNAKAILKSLFNISSYYEIKAISKKMTSEEGIKELNLEEFEARQIHSRTMFWSNYTSRFNRIRILLPKKSHDFMLSCYSTLSEQVEPFSGDEESCEVFIFELEKIIAVEFLRGDLSETRFFKNDAWHAKRLFESIDISTEQIYSMSQLEVHDHLSSWQYYCEKLLRTRFKVLPNDDLPYFKGLPPEINAYSKLRGLPKPAKSYIDERESKLEAWVEYFWQREFSTSKYDNVSDLQKRSNMYLNKAYVAKQLGNSEEHIFYIAKAANQGNPEAMWLQGSKLLSDDGGGVKLRKKGEEWIKKAAAAGHEKAQALVQRL